MNLSPEAKAARARYYRERRQRKLKTASGRAELERQQESYWSRKAHEYAEKDRQLHQ